MAGYRDTRLSGLWIFVPAVSGCGKDGWRKTIYTGKSPPVGRGIVSGGHFGYIWGVFDHLDGSRGGSDRRRTGAVFSSSASGAAALPAKRKVNVTGKYGQRSAFWSGLAAYFCNLGGISGEFVALKKLTGIGGIR